MAFLESDNDSHGKREAFPPSIRLDLHHGKWRPTPPVCRCELNISDRFELDALNISGMTSVEARSIQSILDFVMVNAVFRNGVASVESDVLETERPHRTPRFELEGLEWRY